MFNVKRLSMIASLLLVVGIIGSLFTYRFTDRLETITEEIPKSADHFTAIEIAANNGKIELISTNDAKGKVEVSGYQVKEGFSMEVVDDTLSISYQETIQKLYNFDIFKKGTTVKVYLPEKQYEKMIVRANNGRIIAQEIIAVDLQVAVKNGTANLEGIEAETLTIQANNGRVSVKESVTNATSVVSHNGKVELENVEGELLAKANNGRINLISDTLNNAIDFSTKNGKIHILTKSKPTDAIIRAQSKNGQIKIYEQKITSDVFGEGQNTIELAANNGKIIVEQQ